MSAQHTAMASYTLLIDADSGYTSTTEGRCTAAQYGAAIAALHSRPNTYTELNAKCDEMLAALIVARSTLATALISVSPDWFATEQDIADHLAIKQIDAAIQKATGGAA